MNIFIFQISSHTLYDFQDFSIPKVIFHDFPDLEKFYFKFPMTFQTFPGSVDSLYREIGLSKTFGAVK